MHEHDGRARLTRRGTLEHVGSQPRGLHRAGGDAGEDGVGHDCSFGWVVRMASATVPAPGSLMRIV